MGKTVGIFGPSGDGKTTSAIINPDGTINVDDIFDSNYAGMNPDELFIINFDNKELPFPEGKWSESNKNYIKTKDISVFRKIIEGIAKQPKIKAIMVDTLNIYLAYKEYNDRKKMTFDQWRDVTNDIVEIIDLCNNTLRDDQIAYILGHTELMTDSDGLEKRVLSAIGKKQKKQQPEGFFPIVLFTYVEDDGDGNVNYFFETKKNRSSAKTPLGMFKDFRIPNSLALVDRTIRKYYGIS